MVAIYALLECKIFGRTSGPVDFLTNLKSGRGSMPPLFQVSLAMIDNSSFCVSIVKMEKFYTLLICLVLTKIR